MARLGIAAGGAWIGSSFGPTGVAIGWIAGTLLGGVLFPPDPQRGARINDLNVTSSTYGAVIPMGFGVIRQGGNCIWSTGLIEHKNTRTEGKGGQKFIDYTYSAAFAISFGRGPADDVLRIWADGKLIFDKQGAGDTLKIPGLAFRFYPGDEEQLPDSLIEADVGVDMAPAYRGQVYVVFDDLPLSEFGNRIPQLTAEIAYTSTSVSLANSVVEATTITGDLVGGANLVFAVDWTRQYAYAFDTDPFQDPPTNGIHRLNMQTMAEDRQVTCANSLNQDIDGESVFRGCALTFPSGRILVQLNTNATSHNTEPFAVLDPVTLHEITRWGVFSSGTTYTFTGYGISHGGAPIKVYGPEGIQDWAVVYNTVAGSFGILYCGARSIEGGAGTLSQIWNSDENLPSTITIDQVRGVCSGKTTESAGFAHVITGSSYTVPSSDPLTIWTIKIPPAPPPEDAFLLAIAGATNPATGILLTMQRSLTQFMTANRIELDPGDIIPAATDFQIAGAPVYDEADGKLIFHVRVDGGGNPDYLVKVDPSNGDVAWFTEINTAPNDGRWWSQSRVRNDTFGFIINDRATLIDTRTGELLLDNIQYPVGTATGSAGAYDSSMDGFVALSGDTSTIWNKYYFRRAQGEPALLSDVVTTICESVGLDSTDIDVTDLVDDEVAGYLIARQVAARQAIEPLMAAYFFDGVESDFLIKFPQRPSTVARTITQEEVMLEGRTRVFTPETRTQELELPARVATSYLNPDREYAINTQSYKRILSPSASSYSDNEVNLEYPGVLTADRAKQLSEISLFTAWTERTQFATKLAWTHIDLDPTDVITFVYTDGETKDRLRMIKLDVSDRMELDLEAVPENTDQFTSDAVADAGAGDPDQVVPYTLQTRLFVLDIPLLRDSDEPAGRTFVVMHFMMGGYGQTGWMAGNLYKSATIGGEYQRIGRLTDEMTWGSTVNSLGDPPDDAVFSTDTVNELTVFLATSDDPLETVTAEEMLSGANAAALLKVNGEVEIIQFQNVTANLDGSYTLDTLLRGRRGTDTMAYDHSPNEVFLLLVGSDLDRFSLELTETLAPRYYKATGDGQMIQDADIVVNASEGRSLMPWAPVQIEATLVGGNDIDLEWIRRDRVGGGLSLDDLGGDEPLNEDDEEYEIDIYDMPGGTIVRTVTGLTTPDYTYTSANQVTDGFSPPLTELTLAVYQISGQVGRGFGREQTIDVV